MILWLKPLLRFKVIYRIVINDVLSLMDPAQPMTVTTQYAVRDFYHRLYVYNYNNSWLDKGYSLSRYYYRWSSVNFVDKNGTVHFDDEERSDGNYASHHQDYNFLSQKTIDAWNNNYRYVEHY